MLTIGIANCCLFWSSNTLSLLYPYFSILVFKMPVNPFLSVCCQRMFELNPIVLCLLGLQ